MQQRARYSFDEAKARIEAFCAYQERCEYEVILKLNSWKIHYNDIQKLVDHLVDFRFLDNERFAEAYAQGKFRIKRWGKQKIRVKMKEKRLSDSMISSALDKIDEMEYQQTIEELIASKFRQLKDDHSWENKVKVRRFLLNRGFENELVYKALERL